MSPVRPELALYCLPPLPSPLSLVVRRYKIDTGALQQLTEPDQPLPAQLDRAVLKRQIEFAAGRWCALRALRQRGYGGPASIPIGRDRAPCWPMGYVGSISHSKGLAVAIAGERQHFMGVGIDIERPVAMDTLRLIAHQIATQAELAIGLQKGLAYETWATLVFSAKESLFKALYPTVGHYFDFLEASVSLLDTRSGHIYLKLLQTLSSHHIVGHAYRVDYAIGNEYLVTRCVIDRLI
ncbi:enterobactin synthetase component D [Chitinivorax tropicus]|uniref:Enterobactin synthase component D n=1 Tax=Chitinivorax tropicus TaxID=714531 RepID=A0A840MJM4_9PROT|nr:4'-phosphopantetheinyl transferase superfamily protein [Chitinivorax tropicus]MBB5016766.1 enterobactin synthetase component D [Chitinivorax tropicus]